MRFFQPGSWNTTIYKRKICSLYYIMYSNNITGKARVQKTWKLNTRQSHTYHPHWLNDTMSITLPWQSCYLDNHVTMPTILPWQVTTHVTMPTIFTMLPWQACYHDKHVTMTSMLPRQARYHDKHVTHATMKSMLACRQFYHANLFTMPTIWKTYHGNHAKDTIIPHYDDGIVAISLIELPQQLPS